MATTKGFATGTVPQPAGTTALDTRKANAFRVVNDAAGAPRTGVLGTNPSIVTTDASTAPMRVAVAKAGFVTSRSVGDGVIDWSNDGSIFVTVTKPLSNSHIVVIYAKHNDAAAGDLTSLPVVEAIAGAAAASPSKPAIPSGAEELATLLVPSTATSTQSAGVVLTNTYKMTAAVGGVVPLRDATELAAWTPGESGLAYRQDIDTLLVYRGSGWTPLDSIETASLISTSGTSNGVAFWTSGALASLPYATVIDLDWIGQAFQSVGAGSLVGARFVTSAGTLIQATVQRFYSPAINSWVSIPWTARVTIPANTVVTITLVSDSNVAVNFNGMVRSIRKAG